MHTRSRRFAFALTSLAMALGTTACGGGGDGSDASAASALDTQRADALARRNPPPPPPPPAPDTNLVLASAGAAGQAADGIVCGISADGGKVLFASRSATLVSGDSNVAVDLFLKDLRGNGVTRVVTSTALQAPACLGMTPDANTVAYLADVTTPGDIFPGGGTSEPAILLKNLGTGQTTRVTPPLATFPNVAGFQFAGVSDDGLRVAFIAQPTRSCSGYD